MSPDFPALKVLVNPTRAFASAAFASPFIPPLAARPALAELIPAFTVPTPLTPFCTVPNVIDPPLNPLIKDLKNPSPADLARVNPFPKAPNMSVVLEVMVLTAEEPVVFKEDKVLAPDDFITFNASDPFLIK